jgi:hypothetical protein
MANHRNRKLLDLAHELHECTNCGAWWPEGLEPAHQNGIVAGKGFGIKSNDFLHAAMCNLCHRFYDSGSTGMDPSRTFTASKEDKAEMWQRAHQRTYDLYWSNGWLTVAKRA